MQLRRLSQIEQAFTLTNMTTPMVVVSVFRLENGPAPDMLRQALSILQNQQPLLQAAIQKKGRHFVFEALPTSTPIPLSVEAVTDWRQRAQELLNEPFDHSSGPLMRCVYSRASTPQSFSELICVFHHAVMDGVSGVRLIRRLLALCDSIQKSETIKASSSSPVRPPLDDLAPKRFRSIRLATQAAPFIARQLHADRTYQRALPAEYSSSIHPPSTCRIVTRHFDQESTERLTAAAQREKTHLNSVIAAAIMLSTHRIIYDQALSSMQTIMFADMRRHARPRVSPDTLGCYISMLRNTISIQKDDTVWNLARRLTAAMFRSGRRGEPFLAAQLSKRMTQMMLKKNDRRMANTALSFAGMLDMPESVGSIRVQEVHAFITANHLAPEISAYGHVFQGRLSLDMMYIIADMDDSMGNAVADEVVRILKA